MPVPPPRSGSRLALVGLCCAWLGLGCGDAHWATTRWPSEAPGTPKQPVLHASELGLAAQATAIDYEPDGIVVSLALENVGDSRLRIERAAILLGWDDLEYPVEPPELGADEPEWIELEPGAVTELRLRYHLGRPLSGPGSQLIFRALSRDQVAVVDLPRLELPAMPAR